MVKVKYRQQDLDWRWSLTERLHDVGKETEGHNRLRKLPEEKFQSPRDDMNVFPLTLIQIQLFFWDTHEEGGEGMIQTYRGRGKKRETKSSFKYVQIHQLTWDECELLGWGVSWSGRRQKALEK